MFKLEDIVELAKAGYKAEEVKELIKLSKNAEAEPEDKQEEVPEDVKEEASEDKKDEKQEELPSEDPKVVDYKKKVEELENKISALQKANTRQNMADTDVKSDSEAFADVMRSFM